MKHYSSYMDRQEISFGLHEKLLDLTVPRRSRPWARYGALAACAALIIGVGAWRLAPRPQTLPAQYSSVGDGSDREEVIYGQPGLASDSGTVILGDWDSGFVVYNHTWGELISSMVPDITFPDRTESSDMALSRVYAPGSFTVDLTKEDIQKLFWGPEGAPGADDLPWVLSWHGYTVHGTALYDGQGRLMELTLYGEKGRAGFEMELCPGAMPFTCCVDMDRGDEISEFNGVKIAGWSKVYDRDGDGFTDYICGSEFMTENGIGVRFTSQNNGGTEDSVDGAAWFNTLFVCQALTEDGGLHLDHLMVSENIPVWREEEFSTLAQARQETDFAPYLPQTSPMPNAWEFYGHLSYQEGKTDCLWVRWSREYDNVEVKVCLPGDSSADQCEPVDINVPASYDTRLYEIPWSESVPEEYRASFFSNVTFRAQDMSLEAVRARETAHDTGGSSYRFRVLHEDGTVVVYSCDGMTAEQVWEMVEKTL